MAGFNTPIAHVSLDKTAFPSGSGLRDGGFVFVRVLSSSTDGKALVSFGGRQFEVNSLRNLETGTSFKAQVKITGNTLFLVPQMQSTQSGEFRQVTAANLFNPQNAAFFAALGLPADSITFQLLQQFQQTGLKINIAQLLKAKKIAATFPYNEDDAGETALFLMQKDIEPDAELVAHVLQLLQNGSYGGRQQASQQPAEDEENFGTDDLHFPNDLYENDTVFSQLPSGLLTLINHLKSGQKHWIILPYEYASGGLFFDGTIRLLCDTVHKKCEKMAITVCFPQEKHVYFVHLLDYNSLSATLKKSKISIYYSCEPALTMLDRQKKSTLLAELFEGFDCTVTYSESLVAHNFFIPELPLCSVQMDV